MASIGGVLLDVGGVLLRTPWEMLPDFEARQGLVPGTLAWRGPVDPSTDPLWRAVQAGDLAGGAYFARRAEEVSALLGTSLTWVEVTGALFDVPEERAVRREGAELVDAARAAGLRTGILTSKLVAFLGRDWIARSMLLTSFDALLDASETGVDKPDPLAYEQAVEALGLEPGAVLFVDDSPGHVAGARAAGLEAEAFLLTDPAGSFARVRRRLGL